MFYNLIEIRFAFRSFIDIVEAHTIHDFYTLPFLFPLASLPFPTLVKYLSSLLELMDDMAFSDIRMEHYNYLRLKTSCWYNFHVHNTHQSNYSQILLIGHQQFISSISTQLFLIRLKPKRLFSFAYINGETLMEKKSFKNEWNCLYHVQSLGK